MVRYIVKESSLDKGHVLWVMLHGFLQKGSFPVYCGMENIVPTAYLLAPHSNWNRKLAGWVVKSIEEIFNEYKSFNGVVLAGNSDGGTWAFHYANEVHRARLSYVFGVVSYGGLWKGIAPESKTKVALVIGRDDPIGPVRRATEKAARELGVKPLEVEGGHLWNSANNKLIFDHLMNSENREW